jgi:outer membrane protein TolC
VSAPAYLPAPLAPPASAAPERPLPINLPTALHLAGVRPIDIALASERIAVANAQLERAEVLWLPTIYLGADYFRHDGQIQDVAGNVFGTSKSSFLAGAGPSAVFAVTDALFAPLAARLDVRAREATLQAARNDSLLSVAETYFNVQQARGELAGAADSARRAENLVRRITALAQSITAPVDLVRARAELSRRRQAVDAARERWRIASAELARVLRLDPSAVIEPLEPPHLQVTLVPLDRPVDDLIPIGLMNRPELAAQQALVQATLERLRQERLRPLIPSVLLRGASTPVTGTLAGGYFGGGVNGRIGDFGARFDCDVQLLWEWQNLGLGNGARVEERRSENRLALLELFRTQDRVAAEVVQAYAQSESAAARLTEAGAEVRDALESLTQQFAGLEQTQRAGNLILPLIRPQEAVAAVQALAQAYNDYYGAVGDYDRAQFRLYRALGQPAQALTCPAAEPPPQAAGADAPHVTPGEAGATANVKKN